MQKVGMSNQYTIQNIVQSIELQGYRGGSSTSRQNSSGTGIAVGSAEGTTLTEAGTGGTPIVRGYIFFYFFFLSFAGFYQTKFFFI